MRAVSKVLLRRTGAAPPLVQWRRLPDRDRVARAS